MNLEEILKDCPKNRVIIDNIIKAYKTINNPKYKKILCAISGGADSDVMLDICYKCDKDKKIDYIWYDTGLEYQATKDHLKFLEEKYGIKIIRERAKKPIPLSCREYGQPFLSKRISDYVHRLQSHGFKFEDRPFEELYKEYPKCKASLLWWCNANQSNAYNICRNKWVKEFLVQNPPTFKISDKCCHYAKKGVAHKVISEGDYDLNIVGVRKAEGGVRSITIKSCFSENYDGCDVYRPLFWYKDDDKVSYEDTCGIVHSKCYTQYGLIRTGCSGCPFGQDFEKELEIIEKNEPKLYGAVNKIFKDSYDYTRKYRKFCEEMDTKYGSYSAYLSQQKK